MGDYPGTEGQTREQTARHFVIGRNQVARYSHRIAISNHRIIGIANDAVLFRWRDDVDGNKKKVMALDAHEFIRRFLLHVLPKQFVKIRHFGLFSNRNRRVLLDACRAVLRIRRATQTANVEQWKQTLLRLTGIDVDQCPCCCSGKMMTVSEIRPAFCREP